MFRWEPEGRYCCTKSMAIAPFWLSTDVYNADNVITFYIGLHLWSRHWMYMSTLILFNNPFEAVTESNGNYSEKKNNVHMCVLVFLLKYFGEFLMRNTMYGKYLLAIIRKEQSTSFNYGSASSVQWKIKFLKFHHCYNEEWSFCFSKSLSKRLCQFEKNDTF